MKKHLVLKNDSSDKFWEIEAKGKSFKVSYGKRGTDGVTQVKEFPSVEKCEAEAHKLVAEKIKKGYKEIASRKSLTGVGDKSTSGNYKSAWDSIEKSKDQQKALLEHFGYLADSQISSENLRSILARVKEVSVAKENELCLRLDLENLCLIATAPSEAINHGGPKSFREYQKRHEFIFLTDRKNLTYLTLGETGTLDRATLAENMNSNKFKKIISPLSEMSDWWIYHPTQKNNSGEPLIYYVDHEDMELGAAQSISAGALFLMRCLELLKDENTASPTESFPERKKIKSVLGSGPRYFVDNVNILDFHEGRLQRLKFQNGEFIHLGVIEEITETPVALYFSQQMALIRSIDRLTVFVIDQASIKKAGDFPFNNNHLAPVYYKDLLLFYDPELKSFIYHTDSKKNAGTAFRNNLPEEILEIRDAAVVNNIILFADKRFLLGFKVDTDTWLIKEVFKMRCKHAITKLIAVPNSSFLIALEIDLITFYQIDGKPTMLTGDRSRGPIEAYLVTESQFIGLSKHIYETFDKVVTARQITVFDLGDFPKLKLQKDLPQDTPKIDQVSNIARNSNDLILIEANGSVIKLENFF